MSDIRTIVDHIGRTVVGVVTEENDTTITINNPVIIHVQPNQQNGQLQVQSFPYLFMEFIKGDKTILEKEPLENLSKNKELVGYKHEGFWYACDTLRDKIHLENLWNSNKAPWKIWNE